MEAQKLLVQKLTDTEGMEKFPLGMHRNSGFLFSAFLSFTAMIIQHAGECSQDKTRRFGSINTDVKSLSLSVTITRHVADRLVLTLPETTA